MSQYFTIGMAGHIDHGKTTLTKALTGIDTDRLKEEKERNISIEAGYAAFIQEEDLEISIIDVPGHVKFIRQMIAGVAGIDLVILVISADEGIMPQTREHLNILTLLGIKNGIIAITKLDQSDPELLDIIVDDIKENMKGTFLEKAPLFFVDSISEQGIPELKTVIREIVLQITKEPKQAFFRLPIDQVFTVKGQGVIVRGTIYNGEVREGDILKVLPTNKEVRVRQIQAQHQRRRLASQGQRAAINIGGISHDEVSRGDVLVGEDYYSVSNKMDVVFYPLKGTQFEIKQRQPIKLYIGTSEVMGKIVFFDRNDIRGDQEQEVLCQIEVNEKVVVTRGDRFILRKPSPEETMGGGWIIEPNATKHRFGTETINQLTLKKEGSVKDRVLFLLEEKVALTHSEIVKELFISEEDFNETKSVLLEIGKSIFTTNSTYKRSQDRIIDLIETFHERFPMRRGINKAEVVSEMEKDYPVSLVEFVIKTLQENEEIKIINQYISMINMKPRLPDKWKTELEKIEERLIGQGAEVDEWNDLLDGFKIPLGVQEEYYYYLIQTEKAFVFEEDKLISKEAVEEMRTKLKDQTRLEDFNLQTAREIVKLTRKNLVPLLELFDKLGFTERDGNTRKWIGKKER